MQSMKGEDKRMQMQQQNQIANTQQVQFLEKKLTLAEEKNEALKSLIQSKDEEIENSLS